MLSEQAKAEIFDYLKKAVVHQGKIRRCEIEGMVWGVEQDLANFQIWGFITFAQEDELLALLK